MELHTMPNNFVHAIYKNYMVQMSTEEGRKAVAAGEVQEQLAETLTGG